MLRATLIRKIGPKVCALVEFEKTEFAMKAVKDKTCEEEDKMKVTTAIGSMS
jgi:hypothetical protein